MNRHSAFSGNTKVLESLRKKIKKNPRLANARKLLARIICAAIRALTKKQEKALKLLTRIKLEIT